MLLVHQFDSRFVVLTWVLPFGLDFAFCHFTRILLFDLHFALSTCVLPFQLGFCRFYSYLAPVLLVRPVLTLILLIWLAFYLTHLLPDVPFTVLTRPLPFWHTFDRFDFTFTNLTRIFPFQLAFWLSLSHFKSHLAVLTRTQQFKLPFCCFDSHLHLTRF